MRRRWRRWRPIFLALALAAALIALPHPHAGASDIFGNVGPASQLPGGSLVDRYPLGHYYLDTHFDAVSASLTGGVDVSGVPSLIAGFLANALWEGTAFLAKTLISLFTFAFSLDLLNGSRQTGGAGALAPVSLAVHSIYANVFGQPWLVLAVTVVGMWAMWKALVQRRYTETAGALALSLIYLIVALAFVAQPARTIGSASHWTNQMSASFLSIAGHGSLGGTEQAKQEGADQLFSLLVYQPWAVLEFGGTEHCVKDGTGSSDSDPISVPVRPFSPDPSRDAALSRRLENGTAIHADGKTCINNVNKYASHFLPYSGGSDERNAEYDALNDGDPGKLPDADPSKERGSYSVGIADKPATDAMEEGGQFQRLLLAALIFVCELGAFILLGALSVGVILSQVLLLLWLAFAPVALVFAVIPGRGHDFFRNWLTRLAGLLLRKAVYSLILAVLLAVNSALASATSQLGWLMSFGLQGLFFWAVFFQRRQLATRILGASVGNEASGDSNPGRVMAYYYGTRTAGRVVGRTARRIRRLLPGGGE